MVFLRESSILPVVKKTRRNKKQRVFLKNKETLSSSKPSCIFRIVDYPKNSVWNSHLLDVERCYGGAK